MKSYVYTYYDPKVEAYLSPVVLSFNPDDLAVQLLRATRAGQLGRVESDVCYCLGDFDDETGLLNVYSERRLVCDLAQFQAQVGHRKEVDGNGRFEGKIEGKQN